MTRDPVVDDNATAVVEVIRQKSPSSQELDRALKKQKAPSPSRKMKMEAPMEEEEKKEEDWEEQGQEACWIDSPVASEVGAEQQAPSSPKRASIFQKIVPKSTGSPKRNKKKKKQSHQHVVLLNNEQAPATTEQQAANNNKQSSTDVDVDEALQRRQAAAAEKASTARKLLAQALSANANGTSRELLAKSAFHHATDARKLVEPEQDNTAEDLDTILQDATIKGQAAVQQACCEQQSLQQEQQHVQAAASRARHYLELILPDTVVGTTKAQDDLSTLGFDNTFEEGKDVDVLSMSSLNEILDGPASPQNTLSPLSSPSNMVKHRISAQAPGKLDDDDEDDDDLCDDEELHKQEKPRGLASLFRRNKKSTIVEEASAIKVTGMKKKRFTKKKQMRGSAEVKRFMATVVVDEGDDDDDDKPLDRDASDYERLKAVDGRIDKALQEAMDADETESLTSLEGVKMFGKQTKPKDDDKKKKSKQKGYRGHEKVPQEGLPKRVLEKPAFVEVEQGIPAILTQKSWESLISNEAVSLEEKEQDVPEESTDRDLKPPEELQSPASTNVDDEDKYLVAAVQNEPTGDEQNEPKGDTADRYSVMNEDEGIDDFCDYCLPSGPETMVRDESSANARADAPKATVEARESAGDEEEKPDEAPPQAVASASTVEETKPTPATKKPRELKLFGWISRKSLRQDSTEEAGSAAKTSGNEPTLQSKAPPAEEQKKSRELLGGTEKRKSKTKSPQRPLLKPAPAAAPVETSGDSAPLAKPLQEETNSRELLEGSAKGKSMTTTQQPLSEPAPAANTKEKPLPETTTPTRRRLRGMGLLQRKSSPKKSPKKHSSKSRKTQVSYESKSLNMTTTEEVVTRSRSTNKPRSTRITVTTQAKPKLSTTPETETDQTKTTDGGVNEEMEPKRLVQEDADPLVSHIKKQQHRQRKGRDPTTRFDDAEAKRQVDP